VLHLARGGGTVAAGYGILRPNVSSSKSVARGFGPVRLGDIPLWGVLQRTPDGAAVPYILCTNDTLGHWVGMMESILAQGVICSIVGTPQPLDMQPLMSKSATFVWEMMFTKSSYQTEDIQSQHHILNRFAQLLEAGTVQGTLTRSLSPINAQNLKTAHMALESGTMIGKFALEGWTV
jgi:NADPH:quinone reductase-like Zn-dependent oxidoreductase